MTPVTPSFDDDERALARALHGRVDQMNESPLGFEDVNDKARGIRRNRRIMIGAGLAAAVAIIVPSALVAGTFLNRSSTPPPATNSPAPTHASQPPAPSPSGKETTAPARPHEQVFSVTDLGATSTAPGVAYAELSDDPGQPGGTIHGPDGRTVQLPPYQLQEFAPLGDRWVVDMFDPTNETELVYVLAPKGDYAEPWVVSGGLGVSPGGNVVAWTGTDGTVYVAHAKTGDILDMAPIPDPGPYLTVGVTSEDCKEGRTNDGGCAVFVNTNGTDPKAFYTTSHGIVDTMPGLINVMATDARHAGGVASIDETTPGSCSDMYRDFGTTKLWSTCDVTFSAISPDGRHVLGGPAYRDGFGPKTLDILDLATGKSVRSWTSAEDSATYFDEVWEDDSHVLAVTFQAGKWSVVRLGVDGTMEYAVTPVDGEDLQRPFVLALH